jgi:heme oxygenase (biliverdin-IX-beta and delta-forming)
MLTRLDMETRAHHAEADAYWLDLMAAGVTREHYKTLLMKLYGFEAPVESALVYTPHLVIADRRERTRSGLIAQDLLELGVAPSRITALPQCSSIAPFADPGEALGWKYVLERPTQMHGAIKRNLVNRVSDVAHACRYLSACDGVAAARWQQLGALLDEVAARPGIGERILDGAKAAFRCLSDWFEQKHEVHG